ncbi:Alpha-ribazole phosphatase [Candidatus Competibacter denitrificans Run_A_D11]|uniref:Alpha-ribazole phosphatase n=1 Tax=Candidatus Competibacter denitrificans Run_A_D11 TaxID=1400863 RepID=W6M807_9GAMM|nr:histidine phosphatase family protein [Candidatus Competibacter denitrificans]CDI02774.1 Alpha-ribazole phosphatase [Candidatus Competibacter denitrificans Run_A_D11]HRC70522.1 histidine phosphatase family protein [Candidatus Competibacter denitrificans]
MSVFTTVDLLRHGEPEGGQKFRGAIDDPLSALGWEQMRTAVGNYQAWDAVISSPLIRCAAFARELTGRIDKPLTITGGFSELSFGIWEGRAVAEVNAADAQALGQFWRDPVGHPIPQGEPVADFDRRIGAAWDGLLRDYQGQHVLLVAHGGVIRMILRRLLDMPLHRIWRIEVPYAAISRIRRHCDPEAEPHLVFHNGHLA